MSAPPAATHDAAPYVVDDGTLERIHDALNHAVRSRAANPLLHMAKVLLVRVRVRVRVRG